MATNKAEVIASIKEMASEGKTRDDVMLYMFGEGIMPSKMTGLIKAACVTFGRTGSGWRQATAKYFAETDTPTYDDWKDVMHNDGDLLLSENNQAAYTNHFKLWVSILNREVM